MHSGAPGIGFASLFTLLVCAAMLTVPGCGGKKQTREQAVAQYSQELREAVSTKVPDEGRKAQMLLVVDQLEALHRRFSEETTDFVERYRKLNADYDATRLAFEQLFSDYSAKRIKARTEALDLHFQLALLASADEWKAIAGAETKLYEEVSTARPGEEKK
jgi:hypothetical protein